MVSLPAAQPVSGGASTKRPRSLERKPTEPLHEPAVQHTRTLERLTLRRVCSVIIPPPRRALPISPHTRFLASPPTSPLTPPRSHVASHDSDLVQTPPAFPFVLHVDDTTSQMDSESQPVSFCPALYTRFALDPRPSAPSPQNASPASPFLNKASEADPKRRRGTTPAPNRYQLRQRPISSSRASSSSHPSSTSKPLPPRTRRMR